MVIDLKWLFSVELSKTTAVYKEQNNVVRGDMDTKYDRD
jgi:hypothetical protein